MSALPGRNDLCHCGSGSKYKKCHLEQDEAARVAAAAAKKAEVAAAAAADPAQPPPSTDNHQRPKHAPKPEAATRRVSASARRRSV